MGALLAAELDRSANVRTIQRIAERLRARHGLEGDALYQQLVHKLQHWRPDIPEDQIRAVVLGSAPAEADGRRPAGRPA